MDMDQHLLIAYKCHLVYKSHFSENNSVDDSTKERVRQLSKDGQRPKTDMKSIIGRLMQHFGGGYKNLKIAHY